MLHFVVSICKICTLLGYDGKYMISFKIFQGIMLFN